tara:strand:+ start:3200 stop:3493 length:294 start_codon:yes stop_codon:yes gene_type:complete
MENSKNDYDKHVEAWENHLAALDGGDDGRWTELTAKEIVKLLAKTTLGLNGGDWEENGLDAADKVGFNGHNVVHCPDGSVQVVTLIEFDRGQKADAA